MNRRTFVTATGVALGSALTGCVGNEGGERDAADDSDETTTADDSDETTANDEDDRNGGSDMPMDPEEIPEVSYEIADTRDVGGPPLKHSVELVFTELRSPEQPLTLALTLENATDEKLAYSERRVTRLLHQNAKGFTILSVDDDRYGFDKTTGWWEPTVPLDRTDDYQIGHLDAGETDSLEVVLVTHREGWHPEEPPQTLAFPVEFTVSPVDEDGDRGEKDVYEWSVTLERVS